VCGRITKLTRIESAPIVKYDEQPRNKVNNMNALKLSRISIVMFGLGLACITARPCRAQAEINPDHYDEAPSSSSISRPATVTQPVAANRSGAAVNASTCAQAQTTADAKRTGCTTRVPVSPAVVRARAITSPAKEKDKAIRLADARNSG
jgi:hypothetical protein